MSQRRASFACIFLFLTGCGSEVDGPSAYGGMGDMATSDTSSGGASATVTSGTPSTEGSTSGDTASGSTTDGAVSTTGGTTTGNGGDGGTASTDDGAGGGSDGSTSDGSTSDGNPFGGTVGGVGGMASSDTTDGTTSTDGSGGGTTAISTGCETVAGDEGTVNQTIVVGPGQTFDGGCKRYTAGPALGDGSQAEGQQPVFRLENGSRLINVVLGSPAADGIHCHGDATLDSIVWEDIGEDALTIKESGTVELTNGAAYNSEDKVFQINAASTFRVSNFIARTAGKFARQNGGTTFKIDVFIDNCDISNMSESIFRTDSSTSTVTMTNTRYSNIGDALFIGVNPNNITESNNTQY